MSSWLTSTNAKEIGTLYLIFAVFAGMRIIMPALYLVICWECYKNKIPIKILLELGENFYSNSLSAVYLILRDFTQDNLKSLKSFKSLFLSQYYFFNSIMYYLFEEIKHKGILLFAVSRSITNIILNSNVKEQNNLNTTIHIKSQLGYYLAGLIESDGTIVTPSLSSSNTPKISIIFNTKDATLASHLVSVLGYGSIQKSGSESAVNLVIRNKAGIIDLLSLINGKFITPKISSLHNLIDWVNNTPTYKLLVEGELEKLPIDTSDFSLAKKNNAWLSGFSEGDSTFQIRLTEGIKYNHVATTYEISQGRLNLELLENYKKIIEDIANLFLGSLNVVYF
jgi:hypothetical protein